jgi:hypothetical protein
VYCTDTSCTFLSPLSSIVILFIIGVNVLSTYPQNNTSSYATLSGTSMSVPHVAGVLALLKSRFPDVSAKRLIHALKQSAVSTTAATTAMDNMDVNVQQEQQDNSTNTTSTVDTTNTTTTTNTTNTTLPPLAQQRHPIKTRNNQTGFGIVHAWNAFQYMETTPQNDCAAWGESKVEFELTTDQYGSDITWQIESKRKSTSSSSQGGVVLTQGGNYPDGPISTYRSEICIDLMQCYTLTIDDAYGDG